MDDSTLRALLSRLNKSAFETFIVVYYNSRHYADHYEHPITPIGEVGQNIYYRGLLQSYGGTLHSVFMLQYVPLSFVKNPEKYLLKNAALLTGLQRLQKFYKGKRGGMVSEALRSDYQLKAIHLISNLIDLEKEVYLEDLLPEFGALVYRVFRRKTTCPLRSAVTILLSSCRMEV